MKIQFNNAKRIVDGKPYEKGVHELPDSMSEHPYIKALIKDKDAVLLDEPKADDADLASESEAPSQPQKKKGK